MALTLAMGWVLVVPVAAASSLLGGSHEAGSASPARERKPAKARPASPRSPWFLWQIPDLGIVRYVDPPDRRALWLGVDAGGVYVPEELGVFDRNAWTFRTEGSWALALVPMLAAGGRHGVVVYDAENTRLQMHEHQFEVSGMPSLAAGGDRWADRLALTVEMHSLKRTWVEGRQFLIGGVRDVVLALGYGTSHRVGRRWRLDWNLQGRYVWVFRDEQRHLRLAFRPLFVPHPGHVLDLELVGFLVHRDERQFGEPLPQVGVYGQAALQYTWLWNQTVGPIVRLRAMTSFMTGSAPVYEIREEAINAPYGEITLGLRFVWH